MEQTDNEFRMDASWVLFYELKFTRINSHAVPTSEYDCYTMTRFTSSIAVATMTLQTESTRQVGATQLGHTTGLKNDFKISDSDASSKDIQ